MDNNDVLQGTVNTELFMEQFIVLRRNTGYVCHIKSKLFKGDQRWKIVLEHYEAEKILNEIVRTNYLL